MMKYETTILIVDDHPLLRRGVREVIAENRAFRVIAEAADGDEALRLIAELKPDLAIVDIDMPRVSGLELLRRLRQLPSSVKTIILTMYREEDVFNAAMDANAKAYVVKDNAANDIMAALEKVVRGETYFSPIMKEAEHRRSTRVQDLLLNKPQLDTLTPSERRILKLIGEDYTSKEIADFLKLSVRTIDNHRQNICRKLNLHGTHSLLKFAFDNSAYL